jgi:hypothetical protein
MNPELTDDDVLLEQEEYDMTASLTFLNYSQNLDALLYDG